MIEQLIFPVIVLAVWTFVMAMWMFLTRIPTMTKMNIKPDDAKHTSEIAGLLPSKIRAVGDNYNHLHEQPTIFYALALGIAIAGHADALFVQLAWAFVGLRILHSLVQVTFNAVMVRFVVFFISWLVLAVMGVREILNLMAS
ncbi:MAG: MAPEG family protein [Parvibaculales bacterium]